jgi:putative hydrolase of the HAD superfamily
VGISIPDRVIVFDYGEVISRSPSPAARAELLDLAGAPEQPFRAAYDRHRPALDHGRLSVAEYWRTIAGELGVEWSPARIHELWVRDFTSWFQVEPEVLGILQELRDGGTRTAILSNAGFDFGDPFRHSPLGDLVERVFVSAELGLLKPEPAIYRHVMRELGVDAAHTAFVDNRQDNVDGAAALGIAAHLFTGAGDLRAFLTGLAG